MHNFEHQNSFGKMFLFFKKVSSLPKLVQSYPGLRYNLFIKTLSDLKVQCRIFGTFSSALLYKNFFIVADGHNLLRNVNVSFFPFVNTVLTKNA